MLHLLLETDLTEEQRDYGDTMKRSTDSLLQIIEDVLDFRYSYLLTYSVSTLSPYLSVVKYKRESWN